MKKIHFCLGYINDKMKANINIACILINEFSREGNEISVSYVSDKKTDISELLNKNITCYEIKEVLDNNKPVEINDSENECFVNLLLEKINKIIRKKENNYKVYLEKITRTLENDTYFFTFCSPFELTYNLLKYIENDRLIFCQLDPWGLHQLMNKTKKIYRIFQETMVFNKSKLIIPIEPLYKQYQLNYIYRKYLSKMIVFHYPLVINRRNKVNKNNDIKIVFFGTIQDKYRNPMKILEFIQKINNKLDKKIDTYFYGYSDSSTLEKFIKNDAHIKYCGVVSSECAYELMNDNVVLLNINNTLTNQIPSKLFDYISTGNPIINVVKNDNDISIKILEKYRTVFNFYESGINDEMDFIRFIYNNERIPFVEIAEKYYYNTPKYVVSNILKALND